MKMRAFALAAVLHASQAVEDESVGAVAKIISMLNDMSAKAKQGKKDEEFEFTQFAQYCRGGKPMLQKQINKAAETIETLTAEIGKLKADAKTLGGEIGALQRR